MSKCKVRPSKEDFSPDEQKKAALLDELLAIEMTKLQKKFTREMHHYLTCDNPKHDHEILRIKWEEIKGPWHLKIDPDSKEFKKSRKKTKEEIELDEIAREAFS